jgi:dsDNA-specific endonuclease/ATPase MutS2
MKSRKEPRPEEQNAAEENRLFAGPVVLPLEDSFDLHAFQPKEISSVVEAYLNECLEAGFAKVRIIHGKGIGVQRNLVRALLEKHAAVVSFRDAPTESGGWGATLIVLKPNS